MVELTKLLLEVALNEEENIEVKLYEEDNLISILLNKEKYDYLMEHKNVLEAIKTLVISSALMNKKECPNFEIDHF